jgi:catechol 2,3-dioxygenase-like lactoylglutathione lyase family enzyme
MRLVKKTVNQDDVSAYHLFYADGKASPAPTSPSSTGPRPPSGGARAASCRPGSGSGPGQPRMVAGAHFVQKGVRHDGIVERDGRWVLDFEDPEGQRLSLVDDGGIGEAHPWDKSTVPAVHQIRGLGPIRMSVPELKPTDQVLTSVMSMKAARTYPSLAKGSPHVHVYRMGALGPAAELHVAVEPNLPPRAGRGRRPPRGVPDPERRANTRPGRRGWSGWECRPAGRSTGSISAASIFASRTGSCSRSRPTGRASPPTSPWTASASACRAAALPGYLILGRIAGILGRRCSRPAPRAVKTPRPVERLQRFQPFRRRRFRKEPVRHSCPRRPVAKLCAMPGCVVLGMGDMHSLKFQWLWRPGLSVCHALRPGPDRST